jgi:hypothetical protein
VVRTEQVVVDGLRDTHHAALVPGLFHVAAHLAAGVHGVVAAVIEKIPDVIFFEYVEDALEILRVLIWVGDFIPAGAQLGGWGILSAAPVRGILLSDIVEGVMQNARDAVGGAVNLSNFVRLQGCFEKRRRHWR